MGDVRKLVEALRAAGVTVHEWDGWDGRGNQGIPQIDIKGAILHHTATGYGFAFPALVTGRPDLRGMLCNFAGNVDGSLTVTGSGLAWHAGQGAGPSLGPLTPYRNWLNRYTVGLEIVYPGNSPMKPEQYKTALIFAKVVAEVFGGGNIEVVRAHGETNGPGGDGKWDPGWAPGRMIDMNQFRREAAAVSTKPPQDKEIMFEIVQLDATAPAEVREVVIALPWQGGAGGVTDVYVNIVAPNSAVTLAVAHFRGTYGLSHMVADNTVLTQYDDTGGVEAPDGTYSLVLNYNAPLGASVVIEAA